MKDKPSQEVMELLNKWKSFEKSIKDIGLILILTAYLLLFLLWGVSMVVIK
jgi:hypothetical protein